MSRLTQQRAAAAAAGDSTVRAATKLTYFRGSIFHIFNIVGNLGFNYNNKNKIRRKKKKKISVHINLILAIGLIIFQ